MRNISKKLSISKLKLLLVAIISLVALTAIAAWCYSKQSITVDKNKINKPVAVCGIKS
jgi:flagellar basal body-associated protein FliL